MVSSDTDILLEWPDAGACDGSSLSPFFEALSGRCTAAGGLFGVDGTPLGWARGVVAPSMAKSSVVAELFTGRKEAMMADVRGGGG